MPEDDQHGADRQATYRHLLATARAHVRDGRARHEALGTLIHAVERCTDGSSDDLTRSLADARAVYNQPRPGDDPDDPEAQDALQPGIEAR